jgi:cytochrome c553
VSRALCILVAAGCAQPAGSDRSDGGLSDSATDGAIGISDTPEDPVDGSADAYLPDTTAPMDAPVAIDAGPTSQPPTGDGTLLSQQGVYGDFATRYIPSDAVTYTPRWELWTDGATKRRWILLPPGGRIDNTNQDHWKFPVGTRLVKEFVRDGMLVETRIIEILGSGPSLRTYVWNAAQTEAVLTVDGATNVAGTQHDVPTAHECTKCHQSETGGGLGIQAVQLGTSTITLWSSSNMFVVPIGSPNFGPSGNATEVAALGYLHANCGHCHNPNGYAAGTNNMSLRLDAAPKAATSEPGYLTTVNITVQGNGAGAGKRVAPSNPNDSAIIRRMSVRGNYDQMPMIGSEIVHGAGVSTVTSWVNSIAP